MSLSLLRLYLNDTGDPPLFTDTELQEILTREGDDVDAAAAEGWRIKAGRVAEWYDVNLDGGSLSRGDVFKHCMTMANLYGGQSGGQIKSIRLQVTPIDEEETSEFA